MTPIHYAAITLGLVAGCAPFISREAWHLMLLCVALTWLGAIILAIGG